MILHIGHHFYGAGNAGDDLMLGGFLSQLPAGMNIELTCCVPFDRTPLTCRFPQVRWLPYDEASRKACVERCDAWLGLGGSPFQCAVSRWFIDHLEQERRLCQSARKPMFFLGIGCQDAAALECSELRATCLQAKRMWTRDTRSTERLRTAFPEAAVEPGSDLAHAWLELQTPGPCLPDTFAAALNFEFGTWPHLEGALASIQRAFKGRKLWISQERRVLPGAEKALYQSISSTFRAHWELIDVDPESGTASDLSKATSTPTLKEITDRWPVGERLLSSRFHSTLVGAWAGSKIVVVAINDKLRSVATELHLQSLDVQADPAHIEERFRNATPVPREHLRELAGRARASCAAFWTACGIEEGRTTSHA